MPNPFVAGEGDPTADLPGAESFGKIRDQWTTFMGDPSARAALLSAGLQLMQPPSFGDTGMSQIGRAIGAGGETLARREAMDIKQQEADSKAMAREAAANLAGERAKYAGAASQLGSEREANRLNIATMQEGGKRTRAEIGALNDLHKEHNKYILDITAQNTERARDFVNKPPPLPIPTFDEWRASSPIAQEIMKRAGMEGGAPAATPTRTLSPKDQQALDWANRNPSDPDAIEIKRRLGR